MCKFMSETVDNILRSSFRTDNIVHSSPNSNHNTPVIETSGSFDIILSFSHLDPIENPTFNKQLNDESFSIQNFLAGISSLSENEVEPNHWLIINI